MQVTTLIAEKKNGFSVAYASNRAATEEEMRRSYDWWLIGPPSASSDLSRLQLEREPIVIFDGEERYSPEKRWESLYPYHQHEESVVVSGRLTFDDLTWEDLLGEHIEQINKHYERSNSERKSNGESLFYQKKTPADYWHGHHLI